MIHVSPGPGKGNAPNAAELQPQLEELVSTQLVKNHFTFAPGRVVSAVETGDIAQTICGFSERLGASLLVIGRDHLDEPNATHTGRLRSHTYSIIRQASCPVLSL